MMQVVLPRLLLLVLFATVGSALAQSCEGFGETTLELEGFGTAYFGEFDYDSAADRFQASGGVCILSDAETGGQPLWRIAATAMVVVGVQGDPQFNLTRATLNLPDWTLFAERLVSTDDGFLLEGLSFEGSNVRGRAESARYLLETGGIVLRNVTARGESFRASGVEAELDGDRLLFREAEVTTCVCEGDALYVVAAPSASLDLLRETVVIHDGVLRIGRMEIALDEELELSDETLQGLRFPLQLTTLADVGLTLRTTPLELAEGLALELGLAGIDGATPRGVLLFHVERPGVSATIGSGPLGARADVRRTEALAEGLDFTFGVQNRHWDKADYLHEGYLSLSASETWRGLRAEDRLDASAALVAAASSQTTDGLQVLSPRLVVRTELGYTLAQTSAGTFGFRGRGSLGHYPRYGQTQYGVGITPSWQGRWGPFSASTRYERLWTNSASPFSTTLDRLTERSMLFADAHVSGALTAGVTSEVSAGFRYNFLADGVTESAVETARLTAGVTFSVGGATLRPSVVVELAQLLSPAADPDVDAFVAGELVYASPAFETGLAVNYSLEDSGFDSLELFAEVPIRLEPLTLRPFVAVDFAGMMSGADTVTLSGHGLELTLEGCCGTLTLGYRVHGDRFDTTVALALPTGEDQ